MQMTSGVEYGIEGILYVPGRCGDEPALIRDISCATLGQSTLDDILQATS